MAGGKGKHGATYSPSYKNNYVHPSLRTAPGSSSPLSQSTKAGEELPETVNERIAHLRRTQPSSDETIRKLRILNMSAASRRGRAERTHRAQRLAGPAAPLSWLSRTTIVDARERKRKLGDNDSSRLPQRLDYLPNVIIPLPLTLVHQVLKALASDFADHVVYDHYYLSTLPVSIKSLLLHYIACYGPEDALSLDGLHALFDTAYETGLTDTSGTEGLTHLDLGRALGKSLKIKQLEKYWNTEASVSSSKSKSKQRVEDSLPDSWDEVADGFVPPPIGPSSKSFVRFPHLTHLSLAFPSENVSWTELLSLGKHFGSLTHLSLAGWPMPRLLSAQVRQSTSNVLDSDPDEVADAAYMLRQFSRHSPSLQYLSLDRCQGWWDVLRFEFPPAVHWTLAERRRRTIWDRDPDRASPAPSAPTSNASNASGDSEGSTESAEQRRREALRSNTVFAHWRNLRTLSLDQLTPIPHLVSDRQMRELFRLRKAEYREAGWTNLNGEDWLLEGYYLRSDDPEVLKSVTERKVSRQWVHDEKMKIRVRVFLNEKGMDNIFVDWLWDEDTIKQRFPDYVKDDASALAPSA